MMPSALQSLRDQLGQVRPTLSAGQLQIKAAYLQSIGPVERACYERHWAGDSNEQIARDLRIHVHVVRSTLGVIMVELRMRLYPVPPSDPTTDANPSITEQPLQDCIGM
jgi:hypothetical protein